MFFVQKFRFVSSVSFSIFLLTIILSGLLPATIQGEETIVPKEFPKTLQKYERLPLGSITADGWLKMQLEISKNGMGGHLDELEPEMIGRPYVDRSHKSAVSPGWSGEISGTYWAGLVQLAYTLNDSDLKAKAEKWVKGTCALQEKDGYLGSYRPTENRQEDYCAWSANWCYRALLGYYEATGDQKILSAVHRGLVWFTEHWNGEKKTPYAGPVLMESMMYVYFKTGDKRLLNWCVDYITWLDKNDVHAHGLSSLLRPELEYNEDHVVAFGENFKNPGLVYAATGNEIYLRATENALRQALDKIWQCTGAPASNFEGHSPPSVVHETEYCNFSTWNNSFSHLACLTGRAEFGNLMERILFNGAMGARKKDDRAIAYNTSPNQLMASLTSSLYGNGSQFGVYAPNYKVACCPAQSVRIYPEYIRAMCLKDCDNNLAVPVYGPCRIQMTDSSAETVLIEEKTMYPFDETILFSIKMKKACKKSIRFRLPDWCRKFEIQLNGQKCQVEPEKGWLVLDRTWNNDQLEIKFVMEPKIVAIKDVYFQGEPLRTIECGPLVFALQYKESWTPIAGSPLTPLPKDWSWYNVTCNGEPGFFAIDLKAIDNGKAIKKIQKQITGYPWTDSPLKLSVPLVRAQKYAWPRHFGSWSHSLLPYGNPVTPDPGAKPEEVTLVPFGSTILRLTAFPIVKQK